MNVELDPRVAGYENKLKLAGAGVVVVVAGGVVVIGGLTVIAASAVALGALGLVNFVPVAARYMALKKQQGMTALAETFSEETIRKDEADEALRVAEQQQLFTQQSAEIGNIIEEISSNLSTATAEERVQIQGQIDQLNTILVNAETAVRNKADDLVELKRVNKIYIGFHRAAKVLKSSQELERNAQDIQQVETARQAIKTRMRQVVAGQKLEAMNAPLRERLSVGKVAQIATSPIETIQPTTIKEKVNVPTRR